MATAAASVRNFQPSANVLSRSKGHSAAGKAAYNARCVIENERTGRVYSFEHLPNKVLSEHFFPAANSPEWAKTRSGFWNGVEKRENRTDSQLAMDWVIPLPHELEANPKHALLPLTDFIRENFTRKGYTADLVFHPAHDHGDERNFHAHLMVGIRRFEKDGSWAKMKDGVPDPAQLRELRERMTAKLNRFMERQGYEIQLETGSYEDRGIDREATVHMGKDAAALERRGIRTEVGDMNREIQARNAEREAMARNIEREQQAHRDEMPVTPARSVTAGRSQEPESIEVESAVERLKQEAEAERTAAQKRADRDLARGTSMAQHARELMSAVRRLFVTMGGMLGNVIQLDRGDVNGQGATFRTEALDRRKRLEELEAASYKTHIDSANEKAAKLAKEAPTKKAADRAAEAKAREVSEREAKIREGGKGDGQEPEKVTFVRKPSERLQRTLKRPRPGHPEDEYEV